MKWLGQYIQDFTARFRNDVYLDSIATGTIASGGSLGLDSNNKIVKATASSGGISHDGSTANGVLTYKDADEATVESNLTFDGSTLTLAGSIVATGDSFTFQSGNADDPNVVIKNTTNDNQAARLTFMKDRGAAMADGDRIAEIDFFGEDASQNSEQYAKVMIQALESDHGSETGMMKLQVAEYDGSLANGLYLEGGTSDGIVNATIGNNAASVTTIAGTLTMGSTAAMTNAGLLSVANQSNITGVGTITSGTWQGTDIGVAHGGTGVSTLTDGGILLGSGTGAITATAVLGDGEILIGDGTTDPVALDVGSSTAITVLGTVATGTWEGTAIASDQQKHVMHYQTTGYSTGDGSNYEMSKQISANTAPFNHETSIGSDGLTAQTPQQWMRTQGHVMPRACTLKSWKGWAASAGSGTTYIALFKVTMTRNSSTTVSAVLLSEFSYTALGNNKNEDFNLPTDNAFAATAIAAGDIVFTAMKGVNAKTAYFNGTFEVEF